MIIGLGIDICEVNRIEKALGRTKRFKEKIFTLHEIEYCISKNKGQYHSFAARFAAKEAFSKALGSGIGAEFKFHDIEILNDEKGKPFVKLLTQKIKSKLLNTNIHLSLTHSKEYAVANIILEKTN